tara:strand:- start:438 stop:896 length:459 start_codon:yes stop_codon:yes gene_type:complete
MERTQARIVDVPLDAIYDDHANKGEFIDMDESFLTNMFKDLVLEEGYELGNEFNLGETHGADYYEERNPGFPEDWYEILADEDKRLNKEYKDTDLLLISNASAEDQQSIQADAGEPPVDCEKRPEAHGDIKAVEQAVEPVVFDTKDIPADID